MNQVVIRAGLLVLLFIMPFASGAVYVLESSRIVTGGNVTSGFCPGGNSSHVSVTQNITTSGPQCVLVARNPGGSSGGGVFDFWRLAADSGSAATIVNNSLVEVLSGSGISTSIVGNQVFIENTGVVTEVDPLWSGEKSLYTLLSNTASRGNWTADRSEYVNLSRLDNATICRPGNGLCPDTAYNASYAVLVDDNVFTGDNTFGSVRTDSLVGTGTNGQLDVSGRVAITASLNNGNGLFDLISNNLVAHWRFQATDSSGAFIFRDQQAATNPLIIQKGTPSNTFVLHNSSFVGVGTIAPAYQLHVFNTGVDTNIFALQDSDGLCLHNPEAGGEVVSCSSDARLKKNVRSVNATMVLDDLYSLSDSLRTYEVKESNDTLIGPIAQLLIETHPHLVTLRNVTVQNGTRTTINELGVRVEEPVYVVAEQYLVTAPSTYDLTLAVRSLYEDNLRLQAELDQVKGTMAILCQANPGVCK